MVKITPGSFLTGRAAAGFFPKDSAFAPAGLCQLDTGSEADLEAAIDPLLCHYQGPIGSLLHRDRMYPDPSEDFTGGSNAPTSFLSQQEGSLIVPLIVFELPGCLVDQRPVYLDSYSGSLSRSLKKDYFLSEHFDLCSSAVLMQLPKPNAAQGPSHQPSEPRGPAEEGAASRRALQHPPPSSTFMGRRASHFSEELPNISCL